MLRNVFLLPTLALVAWAQPQHQHPQVVTPQAKPESGAPPTPQQPLFPGPALRLEDLEKMALAGNPSLKQASAAIRAAEGRQQQAGLYPNPIVGYTADEVSRGPIIAGGEHGAFVEQRIVTGGKLGFARKIAEQEAMQTRASAEAQRYRVLNAVRSLFYQALGEQRLVQVRTQLARLAQRAVTTTRELANVGQADRPDVLAVDIEAQRLELGLITARNGLERTWRQLAAVTGNPALRPVPLEGKLEELPKLEFEGALAKIFEASPELKTAEVGASRADLIVRQAKAAVIPDIVARAGLHYNYERLELNQSRIGWQGSAEVGVALPLFNRNQGARAAAKADAERAQLEVDRTKLALRARLASVYREYQDAAASIERYRTVMIPRAQEAYNLYLNSFRQMAAAYPQVVITQRNLFQLQEDYVAALIGAWQRSIEIQGLLLGAGVEMDGGSIPAMMTSGPGQVDQRNE